MSVQHITWAYKQTGLSSGAKFLLVTLANYANHDGVSWPGQERLSADLATTDRTIRRWAIDLEQAGLVGIEQRPGEGGGRKTNVYKLGQPDMSSGRGQPDTVTGQPDTASANTKEEPSVCLYKGERFGEFWKVYPKKVDKKNCAKKWKTRNLDALADLIIADVTRRRIDDAQWNAGYIPNPQTYLNGDRWEDEIQTQQPKPKRNGSGTAEDVGRAYEAEFGKPPPPGKTTDEVRAMISQRRERAAGWWDS